MNNTSRLQLCKRPDRLMLLPNERFPAERLVCCLMNSPRYFRTFQLSSEVASTEPIVINDMSQMAQLVYQFYNFTMKNVETVCCNTLV